MNNKLKMFVIPGTFKVAHVCQRWPILDNLCKGAMSLWVVTVPKLEISITKKLN